MSENDSELLLGEWITDPTDIRTIRKYGRASMLFKEDGSLIYRVQVSGGTDIMVLKYRVKDGFLITNQQSMPREEKTAFSITSEGKLVLIYGDHKSHFIKNMMLS